MTRWQMLLALLDAAKDRDRIGDVAAFKAGIQGGTGYPEVEAALAPVRGRVPAIDLAALRALPDGTLGREYARFMDANGLTVIAPSDAVPAEVLERAALTIRYGVVHDFFHVLTGFDASWPGEVGVWAFVGGQRYSRGFAFASRLALAVAPLRCPLRLGAAWRAYQRGWAMGAAARPVIVTPLEVWFDRPLVDLRAELGISGATSGYAPGAPDA